MHSKFPWVTHPHTPTAVFDGDGRRIIDQWVAPENWQPIDSAPKQRVILLWYPWHSREELWTPLGNMYLARWLFGDDGRDRWIDPVDGEDIGEGATHWMPTPAPPSDAPTPAHLDPDTAAANAVMIAGLPGLIEALEECVIRLRYDGDLFDNQGNEQRRDASWKAMEMAEAALASIGRTL